VRDSPHQGWQAYRNAFRRDAHQLLAWGYAAARKLISSDSEETEVTGFIAEAIEKLLDGTEIDSRFEHYEVAEDNPIPGESRTGKRRRRADLRIKSRVLKPRPRYIFEAKRLRSTSHGTRGYLGAEGLLRFLGSTSYAEEAFEAAMVGYIQTETPAIWAQKLQSVFVTDSASELRVVRSLEPVTDATCFDNCLISSHTKTDGETIELYHILLDCT